MKYSLLIVALLLVLSNSETVNIINYTVAQQHDKPALRKQFVNSDTIGGQINIGIGGWHKLSLTDPERLLDLSAYPLLNVIKVTQQQDNKNYAQAGDRFLMLQLQDGLFRLSGYNTDENLNNSGTYNKNDHSHTVSYPKDIEGQWYWFYMGYKDDATDPKMYFYAYFPGTESNDKWYQSTEKMKMTPCVSYLEVIIGYDGFYQGANGYYHDIKLFLDDAVPISQSEALTRKGLFTEPEPIQTGLRLHQICSAFNKCDLTQSSNDDSLSGSDKGFYPGQLEYSFSAWIRYDGNEDIASDKSQVIAYISINDSDEVPSLEGNNGDKVFLIEKKTGKYTFTTYSYQNVDDSMNLWDFTSNAVVTQDIPHQENELKNWMFLYMGYKFSERKVYVFMKFPNRLAKVIFTDIAHLKPKTFHYTVGHHDRYTKDSTDTADEVKEKSKQFDGFVSDARINYGSGAYPANEDNEDDLAIYYNPGLEESVCLNNLQEISASFEDTVPADQRLIQTSYNDKIVSDVVIHVFKIETSKVITDCFSPILVYRPDKLPETKSIRMDSVADTNVKVVADDANSLIVVTFELSNAKIDSLNCEVTSAVGADIEVKECIIELLFQTESQSTLYQQPYKFILKKQQDNQVTNALVNLDPMQGVDQIINVEIHADLKIFADNTYTVEKFDWRFAKNEIGYFEQKLQKEEFRPLYYLKKNKLTFNPDPEDLVETNFVDFPDADIQLITEDVPGQIRYQLLFTNEYRVGRLRFSAKLEKVTRRLMEDDRDDLRVLAQTQTQYVSNNEAVIEQDGLTENSASIITFSTLLLLLVLLF